MITVVIDNRHEEDIECYRNDCPYCLKKGRDCPSCLKGGGLFHDWKRINYSYRSEDR